MNSDDLLKFIDLEDRRLRDKFGNYPDEEKRILARTVKLSEETGELSSEILSYNSLQRQEKINNHSVNDLANEFADVIITTLLLAKTTNIDIEEALKNKINKINDRYKTENLK